MSGVSNLKRVAFLTYYFPPIAGGGTPRTTKFVKYLHCFGYQPTVFTVTVDSHNQSREFQLSPEDSKDLDGAQYEVVRVANPARNGFCATLSKTKLGPFLWAALYPSQYEGMRGWAFAAARNIVEVHKHQPFDLIYVSAAPNSALEAAQWAARKANISWVADLRDLWTVDSLKFYPSRLHFAWEQRLEKRVLRSASHIIANTKLSAERLRTVLDLQEDVKTTVITNGYDPQDFEVNDKSTTPRSTGQTTITIVHAGTLYDPGESKSRLGRFRPYNLNNTARSLVPLLSALESLQESEPLLASRFRLRLFGFVPPRTLRLIEDSPLRDQIYLGGAVSHAEAIREVRSADALLALQVAYSDGDKEVPYVPGKVYEYIAAQVPILAIVPPGDLEVLMHETPQAYVADYRNNTEIALALKSLAKALDESSVEYPEDERIGRYSRLTLTRQLSEIFRIVDVQR